MALTTSAVGSYPKPAPLVQARTAYAQGKITREELWELEKEATAFWIRVQEEVGLDVLVHGEMERGDMVAYFAELMPQSMKIGGLVRSYGNRYYHKPVIVDRLRWPGPMTVDMWRYAQSLTTRPVKGMLTGPYTMVEWSFDEFYPTRREAVMDMARVLREEVRALVEAGCRYIQIDEPAIHTRPEEDFALAVEAFRLVVEGIDAIFHTHICYGEVEKIYPQMLQLPVRQIHLALKNTDFEYLKLLEEHPWPPDKELGAGVVDVHVRRIETPEEVAEGIRRVLRHVPPERVWVLPDCGLKTRTVEEARAKLEAMIGGVRLVKQELGLA